MASRPARSTSRSLLRLAVAGAVAVGAPFALAGTANAASDADWDKLAQCESGGKWNTNTGNGFSGGLQFTPSTWRAYGGKGSPHGASRAEQIAVAERVLAAQGPGAWPTCSKKTGLSKGKAQPGKVAAAKQAPAKPAPAKPAPAAAPVAPAAPAAPAAPVAKNGADYTVAAGDTLSKIATDRNIPGGWKAIFDRNADVLSNPNALRPGQQLDLA
jgi:resuscitation-promoting factor RpfA